MFQRPTLPCHHMILDSPPAQLQMPPAPACLPSWGKNSLRPRAAPHCSCGLTKPLCVSEPQIPPTPRPQSDGRPELPWGLTAVGLHSTCGPSQAHQRSPNEAPSGPWSLIWGRKWSQIGRYAALVRSLEHTASPLGSPALTPRSEGDCSRSVGRMGLCRQNSASCEHWVCELSLLLV